MVSLNSFLKVLKGAEVRLDLICDRTRSAPRPPPLGFMICQNMVWLTWPPPLLRTTVRTSSGTAGQILQQIFGGFLEPKLGVLLDRAVQVGHVRLVVLVVMQLHRRFVDVAAQEPHSHRAKGVVRRPQVSSSLRKRLLVGFAGLPSRRRVIAKGAAGQTSSLTIG